MTAEDRLRSERARVEELERTLQASQTEAANAIQRIDQHQAKEKELAEKSRDLVRWSLMISINVMS